MASAYAQLLRSHGLKATPQRLAILETLHEMGGTADVQDLLERVRESRPIHRTTVYRNLEALREIGVVRSVFDGERAFRYELACEHGPSVHPHFHCRRCGRLICMDPVDLSAVWRRTAAEHDVLAESVEVRISGLCNRCRRDED